MFLFNSRHAQLSILSRKIDQMTIKSYNKERAPKLRFDSSRDIEINFAAWPQQSDPIRVDIVRG